MAKLVTFPGLDKMRKTRLFTRNGHVVLEFEFEGDEFEAFFRPELAEQWGRAFIAQAKEARRRRPTSPTPSDDRKPA